MEMCRQKRFGKIKTFTASNRQTVKAPNIRLSGPLGGGPVGDVGVYCVNAARYTIGEEPIEAIAVQGQPEEDPRFREVPNQSASSCVIRPESWRHASVPSELLEARASRCSVRMAPSNESRLQLLRPATFNHQSERWHSKPHGAFHRADRSIRRRDGCVFTVCPAENAGSNSRRSGPAGYANCLGSKRIGSPWRRAGSKSEAAGDRTLRRSETVRTVCLSQHEQQRISVRAGASDFPWGADSVTR